MPAFYAHYRFGKMALEQFPPSVRQSISRFRRLYDMGLQGPDFFFYFNPFFSTSTGDLGPKYHKQPGQEFFAQCCAQANSEAAKVYLYGLLGHYVLDSNCHPFVNAMTKSGQATHVGLEAEFERYLLEMDGLKPAYCQDYSSKIRLTRGECVTVSGFFPPASPTAVWFSFRMMSLVYKFLNQKNRPRAEKIMSSAKKELVDILIPMEPVEKYARMDSELLARFNRVLKLYPQMLQQLQQHMETGEPLGEDFLPSFDPEPQE